MKYNNTNHNILCNLCNKTNNISHIIINCKKYTKNIKIRDNIIHGIYYNTNINNLKFNYLQINWNEQSNNNKNNNNNINYKEKNKLKYLLYPYFWINTMELKEVIKNTLITNRIQILKLTTQYIINNKILIKKP